MPTFDVDRWAKAQQAWAIRIDGREYVARPVSAARVIQAQMELQGASALRQRTVLLGLLRRAFPWRPSMVWLKDPVTLIREFPPAAFAEVIRSFFAWATGNPVTSQTVMGQSPPTSSSPADPSAASASPTP